MTDSVVVLPPGFRVLDSNGDPVSGAKLKFYDAGTTDAKTVYSDSGLSTSLGSTVYCDTGGYPVSEEGGSTKVQVYTGVTAYKLVITTSADVTIASHDNIKGAVEASFITSTDDTITSLADDDTIVVTDASDSGNPKRITKINALYGANSDPTTTLASATTTDIGAEAGGHVIVTGTTTITSLGTVAECSRWVTFQDGLTLTYNATTLKLPGAVDWTIGAGQTVFCRSDASGNWTVYGRRTIFRAYTANDTWTKLDQLSAVRFVAIGGGGGGGGADNDTSEQSCAGGGGAGGVAEITLDAADCEATYAITRGAGGGGGTGSTASTGTAGGSTSVGAILTAGGGNGGQGMAAGTSLICVQGGVGGTATASGGIATPGQHGGIGIRLGSGVSGLGLGSSGFGGSNRFGQGGSPRRVDFAGDAGDGYGGGGSGGYGQGDTTNYNGGPGSNGAVLVWEYY